MIRRPAVLLAAMIVVACAPASSAQPASPDSSAAPVAGDLLWPAPGNPMELAVKAGLQPERKETLIYHVHAHLDVFVDGRQIQVPAGIGINVEDPNVKHGQWNGDPAYGGISGCTQACISPLHTHDDSGVIHTESGTSTPNRLGQFFTEWDMSLTDRCVGKLCPPGSTVAVYVDGRRYSGNPAEMPLTDRKEIAVVIGSPPKQIPSSFPSWAPG
jgi:hypothetical protein